MRQILADIARDYGTPCFVYWVDEVKHRIDALRRAFGGRFKISYAVKANPNPAILRRLWGCADLLDVSSGGELARAMDAGWPAELLSFTGPAKRDWELQKAADCRVGAVVLESIDEAARLNAIASRADRPQPVLIRIAPMKIPAGFGVNMAGKPCQFGIDEEDLDPAVDRIMRMSHLALRGFHIFAGTQCLRAEVIVRSYEGFAELFSRVCRNHDIVPEKLIFGSGLGIPYHDGDQPLDLAVIGNGVNPILDALRRDLRFAQTELVLETGRYLIGEAGLYLTRIISKKRSRGAEIRICDGGMNHHLGACGHLGTLIHHNYRMFKIEAENAATQSSSQRYDIFGPLCTSIDMLAHSAEFRDLDIGDVLAIRCSGAYGLTASPIHFISHEPPKEILIETAAGQLRIEDISQWHTHHGTDPANPA
ncbi:MAG: alanine racemase [Bacillota bacterium]